LQCIKMVIFWNINLDNLITKYLLFLYIVTFYGVWL
jgi:hypothetical protein